MYYKNIAMKGDDFIFKTYNFNYFFNNKQHNFTIEVNLDSFKPGADALYFINTPYECIAQISIDDFCIVLRPTPNSILIDNKEGKTYKNFIPENFKDLLDINAEYNLNKHSISILERNCFEYVVCKKIDNYFNEYSLDFHKNLTVLDSSLDNFIEELRSIAIYFIQEDLSSDIFEAEDNLEIKFSIDDFENYQELPSTELVYFDSYI